MVCVRYILGMKETICNIETVFSLRYKLRLEKNISASGTESNRLYTSRYRLL